MPLSVAERPKEIRAFPSKLYRWANWPDGQRSFGFLASFRLDAACWIIGLLEEAFNRSEDDDDDEMEFWPLTLSLPPLGGARGNLRSVWRSKWRLRQRPMIGTTRQKSKLNLTSKILAPHGYSFSSNANAAGWRRRWPGCLCRAVAWPGFCRPGRSGKWLGCHIHQTYR